MNHNSLNLKIVALDGVAFSGEVLQFSVNTQKGQLTILPNHEPLVSLIVDGPIKITKESGEIINILTSSGVLEIRENSQALVLIEESKNVYA